MLAAMPDGNPFTRTMLTPAGPLAGRAEPLARVRSMLTADTAPGLLVAVGGYGTGKTALLTAAAAEAHRHGWDTATARYGTGGLAHLTAADSGDDSQPTLLTVDDLHAAGAGFATALQALIAEGDRPTAVIAAAHPIIDDLHNGGDQRRPGTWLPLRPLSEQDTGDALRGALAAQEATITSDAITAIAAEAAGNAAMIHLLGYHACAAAGARSKITVSDVRNGLAAAHDDIVERILRPEHEMLTAADAALLAVVTNPAGVTAAAAAVRSRRSPRRATTRLERLERHGLVERCPRRRWRVANPIMARWLQQRRPTRLSTDPATSPTAAAAKPSSRTQQILAELGDPYRPVADIAAQFGVSRQYVSRLAKDHDLPRRRR